MSTIDRTTSSNSPHYLWAEERLSRWLKYTFGKTHVSCGLVHQSLCTSPFQSALILLVPQLSSCQGLLFGWWRPRPTRFIFGDSCSYCPWLCIWFGFFTWLCMDGEPLLSWYQCPDEDFGLGPQLLFPGSVQSAFILLVPQSRLI